MLETIQDFGKNLTVEVMDIPRNLRDLIGGTVAMTIIDNTPLEGNITHTAEMVPGSPAQKQIVAAGLTYAAARSICRSGEKTLGYQIMIL